LSDTTLLWLVVGSAIIVVVSGAFIWALTSLIGDLARKAGVKGPSVRRFRDIMRVVWILLALTAVLAYTGVASSLTALTVSGVAGLAVSLALQSTFSNLISGFLLMNDKVFALGDEIQYGGIKGTVIRMALRSTWVKTQEGNIVMFSNSSLANGPVTNFTAKERMTESAGEV
jgi:small conductance mechanosensitive channel